MIILLVLKEKLGRRIPIIWKTKYNNKIYLSNEGLIGDGVLEYLTSSTKSNEILFEML